MKYTGIPCAACGKKFTAEDDVVVCPECGTPHHRDDGTESVPEAGLRRLRHAFLPLQPRLQGQIPYSVLCSRK